MKRGPRSSSINSISNAREALEQLQRGEASLLKSMRNGRPEMVFRSETEAKERRIAADLTHLFGPFFAAHARGDGLPGFEFSQTAAIPRTNRTE
jgi:hypothetical protein